MAKTKAEKITSIEEEIRQLENRRRQLVQEQKAQERKDRTKRLCRRMGLFESLVPDTIPLTEAEQILFTTAKDYLEGVMNGKTTIPTKTWKEEYTKLTAERKTLNQRYLALKEEVKEAEKIRKSVYSILRQEQRERQPNRAQDMER